MSKSDLVPRVLADYGEATRAQLFRYLPAIEPRRWLYDLVADYPRRGGRSFRPSLCIATARAFGAELDEVLRTAASIEMLHNAMLIHDDIEDNDDARYGEKTLHAEHGVAVAHGMHAQHRQRQAGQRELPGGAGAMAPTARAVRARGLAHGGFGIHLRSAAFRTTRSGSRGRRRPRSSCRGSAGHPSWSARRWSRPAGWPAANTCTTSATLG